MGIVAEECDNPGDEAELRGAPVGLPIPDGRFGHAEFPGDFSLSQPKIKASLPNVVAEGVQLGRIG